MKKSLLVLILIVGLGTAGYYGYNVYTNSQKPVQTVQKAQVKSETASA